MNRAEIIQTLAMRAGMPQIEAGKFMEVFLRKLASLLVHGDAYFLPSFGSFEVVKPENSPIAGEDTVIIYRPEDSFENDEQLVFRVPVSSGETSNQLDLYFSMGVNKPLIPLKGQKFVQDELPTSPLELRKFAEYKADAVLGKGEIRRNAFGTDYNSIKKRYNRSEGLIGSQLDDKPASWEFGDDWKKEYEVETLLAGGEPEVSDEFPLEVPEKTDAAGWDFGGEEESEEETTPKFSMNNLPPVENNDPSPFAPIQSSTRELEIDLSEFSEDEEDDNIEQEAADFDSLFKKSLAENMLMAQPAPDAEDDIFHRVRSTREIPDINIPEDGEPMAKFDGAKFKSMIIDMKRDSESDDDSFQTLGIRDTIERGPAPKPSGAGKWYVLAFILVTVVGSLVYMKLYGIPLWASKYMPAKSDVVITKRVPIVIERDYAFPITYPYPSLAAVNTQKQAQAQQQEEVAEPLPQPVSQQASDNAINKEMEKIQAAKQEAEKQKKEKEQKGKEEVKPEKAPEKISQAAMRQVQQFIFTDGGGFQVQVMSVKSKEIADAEVNRLSGRGYKAFVLSANIPGKGTWYRVRIGNFSSVDEAAKVANKLNLH